MRNYFLLALLILPAVIFTLDNGSRMVSYAEEDPIEDEAEAEVEGENDMEEVAVTEEDEDDPTSTKSPHADTTIYFVKPVATGSALELPAGVPVEFLVGFRNKGDEDFFVDTLDASFRYPMDFNFHIQNFSAIAFHKRVPASQEATLAYSFIPSDAFAGRPFGLNINLMYHDASGNGFQEAVYNETVQIVELEEGLDGETFFLYVFLAAGVVLLLVIGQQTLLSVGRKRTTRSKTPVETGTNNPNNVDYSWLPKSTLASLNKEKLQKSPKSPKQTKSPKATKAATKQQTASPRQRKVKRSTGSE